MSTGKPHSRVIHSATLATAEKQSNRRAGFQADTNHNTKSYLLLNSSVAAMSLSQLSAPAAYLLLISSLLYKRLGMYKSSLFSLQNFNFAINYAVPLLQNAL